MNGAGSTNQRFLTFKLRGWPPRNVIGAPKVQKSAGRERTLIGQSLSNAGLCFIAPTLQKKLVAQPLSRLGLRLAEEEREQKDDDLNQLLVAQLKLDCQFQHGISPVYAGSAANWLGLAICDTPLRGVALGLPRMALSIGCVGFG